MTLKLQEILVPSYDAHPRNDACSGGLASYCTAVGRDFSEDPQGCKGI